MERNHEEQLVILQVFNTTFEANIAKGKLAANGIESFIEEENIVGLNPLGGSELKISSKDLASAQKILSE